jgi:type I restriction enzyme S subunit
MAASEWAPIRLGDVCTKIGSGATPRGGSGVYLREGPYALIRSQNVYNVGFHRGGLAFIGKEHAAELENVEVRKDDVLLNITGDSVARACQVDPGVLTSPCESARCDYSARPREARATPPSVLPSFSQNPNHTPVMGRIGWNSECPHKGHD